MESKCDTMLVIGNGFDLSLGLKTSYGDFMSNIGDYVYSKFNYKIIRYLIEKVQKENWIDIENELKNYANICGYDDVYYIFKNDYKLLCSLLCSYLSDVIEESKDKELKANPKLINALNQTESNGLFILNFNYTDTVHTLFDNEPTFPVIKHHIHGSLADGKDIVFGVEDGYKLKKEHSFLYKSHNRVLNVNHLNERFEDAKHILFYGYSLGQTDHSYFEDFFREQSIKGCERKKFDFFYYDETAYDDLFWQLRTLTNNRMAQFKTFNEVNFIKVKE